MKILILSDPSNPHTIKWVNSLHQKGIEVFLIGLSKYDPAQYDGSIRIKSLRQPDSIKTKFDVENEISLQEFDNNFNMDGKILIHPFGGWAAKEWELEKFILLAEKLSLEYSVEIIAPPNLINSQLKQEVDKREISISEIKSITDLIEKIKECSVFIGNDSGPIYIANMLGKPTFTIYGPTNPDYSVPYGDDHDFIVKTIHCSPEKSKQYCYTKSGFVGCPAFKCMELMGVDEVYNKLLPFVQKHCNKKLKIIL